MMTRVCSLTAKTVRTGNNVSHAHNKTRRRYLPNLQVTSLHSDVLKERLRLRVSTNALRSIDHKGGLDSYLLDTPDEKLSQKARRFKRRVDKACSQEK